MRLRFIVPTGALLCLLWTAGCASRISSAASLHPTLAYSIFKNRGGEGTVTVGPHSSVWVGWSGEVSKLDPETGRIVQSTSLPGGITDLAAGQDGSVYVAGAIASPHAHLVHPAQAHFGGGRADAFIARVDPRGKVMFSTFLGGGRGANPQTQAGVDEATGIAVDTQGNAYVVGDTFSRDFPAVHPLAPQYQAGPGTGSAAFLAIFSPAGKLLYSSTLAGKGGYSETKGRSIALGPDGSIYLAGETNARNFPLVHPMHRASGGVDYFVTRLDRSGHRMLYSTYLGSTHPAGSSARGPSLAVDRHGDAYVVGYGDGSKGGFPLQHALQPYTGRSNCGEFHSACTQAVILELSPTAHLLFSTYFGGSGRNTALNSVALSSAGDIYAAGETQGNLPVTNALQPDFTADDREAFVLDLHAGGRRVTYSTYLGGTKSDWASRIAVDGQGDAYVAGGTYAWDFPGSKQKMPDINDQGIPVNTPFVVKLSPLPGAHTQDHMHTIATSGGSF